MAKLVNIYIDGNFDDGFLVKAEIREEPARSPVASERAIAQTTGRLPAAPHLREKIGNWQKIYQKVVSKKFALKRQASVTNSRDEEKAKKKAYDDCLKATAELKRILNKWLESPEFCPIESLLRNHLKADEEIRVLLETDDRWLRKLPWQEWTLLQDFPQAEVALSSPKFQRVQQVADSESKQKTKILVILGDHDKKNEEAEAIEKQKQEIEELAEKINAEVTWLHQPQRRDLDEPLWRKKWDIIFYAGHGKTSDEDQVGKILINKEEDKEDWLTVSDIKNHLKRAIDYGLKLAIFNACDGLGLAYQLADGEDLHLPQVIVMRDVLPVPLAPIFLKYFLEEFTQGKSLYAAVRDGRQRLQIFEDEFPCASWLPVICQNPAETSLTWQMLGGIPPCPYRGLRAFGEEHAPFFFGREAFTELLGPAVRRKSLVAVIGASGSGKSSVVFAGLIPRLREKGNWHVVSFRPGKGPFESLAAALLPLTGDGTEDGDGGNESEIRQLADDLQQGVGALKDVVESIVRPDSRRLLLVADQFEELYTLCPDEEEQRLFLDCLLWAVKDAACFTLLITLRADFYGYAIDYRPFADALQSNCHNLSRMERKQLSDAIVLPAEKLNVQLEAGLQERLINELDVAGKNLPLLAFTLEQLWYKQKSGLLTSQAYDEIGGVTESLGNHAENVYKLLSEPDRDRARRVFVQLIQPGVGTQDTRRLATRADVGAENWDLVTRLASQDARLVVTDRNQVSGEETVEIVHEALIGGWGRLGDWMKGDREFRSWQEGLRAKMREWEEKENDEGILLRGVPLGEAEGWLQERNEEIAPAERVFVQLSLELRDREKQQRKRLQRRIIGGLTAGLAVASSLAGIATWQWMRSERLRKTAESEGLALSALRQFESGTGNIDALVTAMQSGQKLKTMVVNVDNIQNYSTVRPMYALRTILDNIRMQNQFKTPLDLGLSGVSISKNGKYIVGTGDFGNIFIWESTGELIATWDGHKKMINDVAFSSDSQKFATSGMDGKTKIWEISGKLIVELDHGGSDIIVTSVIFSPDGKYLATLEIGGIARLWDISGKLIRVWREDIWREDNLSQRVSGINFTPDGKNFATFEYNRGKDKAMIRLWDFSGKPTDEIYLQGRIAFGHFSFSPDGNYIAAVDNMAMYSNGGVAYLWDSSGQQIAFDNYRGSVSRLSFSPDGQYLVTVGFDSLVKKWDLSGKLVQTFYGHPFMINDLSFSADGKMLATVGMDGTVIIWNIGINLNQKSIQLKDDPGRIVDIGFTTDGEKIVTSGRRNNTLKIWNMSGSLIKEIQFNFNPYFIGEKYLSKDGKKIITLGTEPNASRSPARTYSFIANILDINDARINSELKIEFPSFEESIKNDLRMVNFSDNRQQFVILSDNGKARIWNFLKNKVIQLQKIDQYIHVVNISPDGKQVTTVGNIDDAVTRSIILWDISGKPLTQLKKPLLSSEDFEEKSGVGIKFELNREVNNIVVTDSIENSPAQKAGIEKGDIILAINGQSTRGLNVQEASNLISGPVGTQVQLKIHSKVRGDWEANITRRKVKFASHTFADYEKVVFSPDSKYLASIGSVVTPKGLKKNIVQIWDNSGKFLAELSGHNSKIGDVIFSKNVKIIATLGFDKTVRLWNFSGEQIAELKGYQGAVSTVSFSPDGQQVATGGQDGIVRLWSLSGQLIAEFKDHQTDITKINFSPNGKYMATASGDGVVMLHHVLGLNDLLARGCNWLKDYFTTHPETKEKLTVCQDKSILHEAEKFLEIDRDIEQSAINFQIQLGKDLAAAGKFKEAVAHFQKALELDPSLDIDPEAEARRLAP